MDGGCPGHARTPIHLGAARAARARRGAEEALRGAGLEAAARGLARLPAPICPDDSRRLAGSVRLARALCPDEGARHALGRALEALEGAAGPLDVRIPAGPGAGLLARLGAAVGLAPGDTGTPERIRLRAMLHILRIEAAVPGGTPFGRAARALTDACEATPRGRALQALGEAEFGLPEEDRA